MIRDRFEGVVSPQVLADAQLVVSELLTNAVLHGRGAIRLRLSATGGGLYGEVVDEGEGFESEMRERGVSDVGGRGLLIVADVAQRWGVHEGSSHVWFELGPHQDDLEQTNPELGEQRRPDELN